MSELPSGQILPEKGNVDNISKVDESKRNFLKFGAKATAAAALTAGAYATGYRSGSSSSAENITSLLEAPMAEWQGPEDPFSILEAEQLAGKMGHRGYSLFKLRQSLSPGSDQEVYYSAPGAPSVTFVTTNYESQVIGEAGQVLFDSRAIRPEFRYDPTSADISPDGKWLFVSTRESYSPSRGNGDHRVTFKTIGIGNKTARRTELLIDRAGGPAADVTNSDSFTYIQSGRNWYPVTASWNFDSLDIRRDQNDNYEGDNVPKGIELTYYKSGDNGINTELKFIPLERLKEAILRRSPKFNTEYLEHEGITLSPDGKKFAVIVANGDSLNIESQEVLLVGDVDDFTNLEVILPEDVAPPEAGKYDNSVVCLGFLGHNAVVALNETSSNINLGHSPDRTTWIKTLYILKEDDPGENTLVQLPLPNIQFAPSEKLPADVNSRGIMLYRDESSEDQPRLTERLSQEAIEAYANSITQGDPVSLTWKMSQE